MKWWLLWANDLQASSLPLTTLLEREKIHSTSIIRRIDLKFVGLQLVNAQSNTGECWMTSRWETWELNQVNTVNNSFYFYFIEIEMGFLSMQLRKIIHGFPLHDSWHFQLSPVFSFPCVSPPVALINLILMVCCHVRVEGHKSDLQAKMMIFALSPKQVSLKTPTCLTWTTTQIFCSFLLSGPSFYLAWQNP